MNNKTVLNLPVKEDDLVLLNTEIIDSKNPYHIADKKTPKVPKAKIPSAMIPTALYPAIYPPKIKPMSGLVAPKV